MQPAGTSMKSVISFAWARGVHLFCPHMCSAEVQPLRRWSVKELNSSISCPRLARTFSQCHFSCILPALRGCSHLCPAFLFNSPIKVQSSLSIPDSWQTEGFIKVRVNPPAKVYWASALSHHTSSDHRNQWFHGFQPILESSHDTHPHTITHALNH